MQFEVNGQQVEIDDTSGSLLEVLRDQLGLTSVKDGCSPQGQCGCCTVLVDGEARVSCVTPARRVADRKVTTVEGLSSEVAAEWGETLCATGGSQCGFCTPGIVLRLEALRRREPAGEDSLCDPLAVNRALAAHLCRCTGWQTIVEAAAEVGASSTNQADIDVRSTARQARDLEAAARRASIEGRSSQTVSPSVVLGHGGFADDLAASETLVAVRRAGETGTASDAWQVGSTMSEARRLAGKVQGRRSSAEQRPPIDLPEGEWDVSLQTGWVDPAYLETDASWSQPGGEPADPLANGGAFGGKTSDGSGVSAVARELADRHNAAVRVRWSREDVIRFSPKRPPMAVGLRADGTGVVRVARTPGIAAAITNVAPGVLVEEIDVAGPPTSARARAAGWAELLAMLGAMNAAADGTVEVVSHDGATASVRIAADSIEVNVSCGQVLDTTVLRSYCIGAVHMALGWVTSEGLLVDDTGEVLSLTLRSLGIVRPAEMPHVVVNIDDSGSDPVCGSDAVFAATAGAVWRHQGMPSAWPSGVSLTI